MIIKNNINKNINYTGCNKVKNKSVFTLNVYGKTGNKDVVSFSSRPKEFSAEDSYQHLLNLCYKKSNIFFGINMPFSQSTVKSFFEIHPERYNAIAELCDKDINSALIDKGCSVFWDYAKNIQKLKKTKKFDILKNSLKCKNINGNQLDQGEKLQILDLIKAYGTAHLSISDFEKMSENGIIDIKKLKENLFINILNNFYGSDFLKTQDCSKEKVLDWNTDYVQFIPQLIMKNKFDFMELFEISNSKDNFKELLHEKYTNFGKNNIKTKQMFTEKGLDYEKWLNYPKTMTVNFDKKEAIYKEMIEKAVNKSEFYINYLYNTPAKTFLIKKYPQFIENNKFVIPTNIRNNKKELQKFLLNFSSNLEPVWERAMNNQKSEELSVRKRAILCLTAKAGLDEVIKENLKKLTEKNSEESYDFTIKMWNRVPQKDLFQGNYSTCCIGIGGSNEKAMFNYLENTAFNMLEIVDNKTHQTIGNALCYYAIDKENKPVFIVDNIEINNKYQLINNAGRELRDGLVEYIKTANKEICKKDIPIYLGLRSNDLPYTDLQKYTKYLSVLGAFDDKEKVYLDLFNGWTRTDELNDKVGMYRLY